MRPAAKKKQKKHTEHERVQFWGTTEHERGPYTHATRQKHTLNTKWCSFEYQWTREGPYTHATRCTQKYKSTYTHWKYVMFNSPNDISQSMRQWKYEFPQDAILDVPSTELSKVLLHKFHKHKAGDVIAWFYHELKKQKLKGTDRDVDRARDQPLPWFTVFNLN